jgi:hypothetical protein
MAMSTLPSSAENEIAFPQAARACGLKVGIGLLVTVSLFALIGVALEHRQTVHNALQGFWTSLLWMLALGGRLWGSVAVGTFALTALALARCLSHHLPEREKIQGLLAGVGVFATWLWLLAIIAMHSTFDDFDALGVFEQVAVVAMHGVPAIALMAAVLKLAVPWGDD